MQLVLENLSVRRIVVQDQNAETVEPAFEGRRFVRGIGLFFERERKPEGCTSAVSAGDANFAIHQLQKSPGDGQSETGAAELAGRAVVGLFEGLEQSLLHL